MRTITIALALISNLVYGQCDIELVGFSPGTGELSLIVHEDQCGAEFGFEGVVELTLGILFVPPMAPEENPFPCVYTSGNNEGWALLNLPLQMPWVNIGEGSDNMLNAGDTVTFNILDPTAGTGTTECFEAAIIDGAFQQCIALAVFNINDSGSIYGEGPGLLGYEYPDDTPNNNVIIFGEGCGTPPPPIGADIPGCIEPAAYNYDPSATVSDGSCVYQGCLDEAADNYCDYCDVEGECFYVSEPECDDPVLWVPNACTPNNDGINDYWQPTTNPVCWRTWDCTIYNRWGGVVFTSQDPEDKWLGEAMLGDHHVADGVYFWQIRASSWNLTKVVDRTGTVTLFR